MMNPSYNAPAEVGRLGQRALIVGVVGLALCVAGYFVDKDQFFRSYLVAFVFWMGIALGCLALMMVQYLSSGAWGIVTRRIFEAASRTIVPLGVILFLPVVFGMHSLYHWTDAEAVAADPILQHKQPYLNIPFFIARTLIYFLIWWLLTTFLSRWSQRQAESGDLMWKQRMANLSGPGVLIYGLTMTFAAFDWVMSLDPHWYSTIFGLLLIAGQGISAMAFAIIVSVILSRREPMSRVLQSSHFHDLGKLLLAMVMLWAYFSYSQLVIIWSGNLPEEIPWYLRRFTTGYKWVGIALLALQFALPFCLLLSRDLKRNARRLFWIALLVIVTRIIDLVWLIGPQVDSRHQAGAAGAWMYIVAPIGLGGIWLWFFSRSLQSRPLLPIKDPDLASALAARQP